MSSRMDKYGIEKPELRSRTEINAELYQNNEVSDYNKVDLNSNISILKADAKNIDINLIKEMLDKKYSENIPKRKSIAISVDEDEVYKEKINTKEYDINEILAKAKTKQNTDYNKERLKKLRDTNYEILKNLDLELKNADAENKKVNDEHELMSLINTITKKELLNQKQASKEAEDLLNLSDESEIEKTLIENKSLENSFYTGNLVVNDKDFEDFKEIQKDIKSNSVLIKILIVLFIIILLVVSTFLLNKYLNLGWF
ncbi:MAG: hypothetical protein PHF21_01295 [Bacilli bacterium]|nr:hypothetical protein [Bacilli bacterium]